MGGNAMKHVGVTRKSAADYADITASAVAIVRGLFHARVEPVIAYRDKESFGDSDILLESDGLPADWIEQVRRAFAPQDLASNGSVVSFDYCGMQIDLISTPAAQFDFAFAYYAHSDLGNLMGRIAHKMGFKFGHDGLWKVLRAGDHKIGDILLTRDVDRALALMGYDAALHRQGFATLDAMFAYAASTPYFHRQIYQLDNRNAISRKRDAKRSSYTGFLAWIADKPELDRYVWASYLPGAASPERDAQHAYWHDQAFNVHFPEAKPEMERALHRHESEKSARQVWNGNVVAAATGLKGKALGEFMAACKSGFEALAPGGIRFEEWVAVLNAGQVEAFIRACQDANIVQGHNPALLSGVVQALSQPTG